MTVCVDHWGDCNNDYRDGCEVAAKPPYYCDGDPRIEEERDSPPSVDIFIEGAGVGRGRFDFSTFAVGLERYLPGLEDCYRQALEKEPKLEAVMSYEFTLGESGRITASKLLQSTIQSGNLEACVTRFASEVSFADGPKGGSRTFPYRIVFSPARVEIASE